MQLNFYTLIYVSLEEKRVFSRRTYSSTDRLNLYVKGACVLDRSLRVCNHRGGVTILTNNKLAIEESLSCIGYRDINVWEIPFSLNVPAGIPFYSAHFKIDVFRYLGNLDERQYSILLDSDVICLKDFNTEFYSLIKDGVPSVYYLNSYGGDTKLKDAHKIVDDVDWLPWAGGEYIGGTSSFFKGLYEEVTSIKDSYWNMIGSGLFHVGDEMLTSIALAHLRKKGICPIDIKWFGIIHRYWSALEKRSMWSYNTSLIHLPGDKLFERDIDLRVDTIKGLLQGYNNFRLIQRLKKIIKDIVKHK